MAPQDLKRLIAGFLVISSVTSVITLISLRFIGETSPQENTLQIEGENPLATISKSVSAENLPPDRQTTNHENQASQSDAASDSSNLTQNLASVFAAQMIAQNPEGPQTDAAGNPTVVNLPGEDKAAEMIKQALSKTAFTFDEQTAVPNGKIAMSYLPDDVSKYLKQVYGILDQVSSSTKSSIAGATLDPTTDSLVPSALVIDAAFTKLSLLSVPSPLVEVQTALLRFFANQKNVFYAVTDYRSDPMKAILAIENEDEIVSRDIGRVKNAAFRVDAKKLSFGDSPEWKKLYSELFGVREARAALGFGDIVFDPSNFANTLATVSNLISNNLGRIAEWAYTTALRVAVNVLINEFQNQVVNWIAGGGKPKFITNWSGFLNDVANKAIGQTINSLVPQLCSGLGPLIRVSLLPVPRADTGVRCTLTQVVNNVNSFFNRFQNGSWYAYGAVLQPQNNYFGALILANDIMVRKTMEETAAANNQAVAYKGFMSVTKCTKYAVDEDNNPTTTCEPGYEITTTPGSIVGETLTQSLGWKPNQIVSAQRFEDLVAAIVNASINRIIKEGLSSLTEAMNPPRPSFTGATPAGVTNPANLTVTKTNISNLMNSYDQIGLWQSNQDIINADTQWLALAVQTSTTAAATETSAIDLLRQLISSCFVSGTTSNLATDRISDINLLASDTRKELASAVSVNNLRRLASTATSTQDIADMLNQLQAIDINQVKGAATSAQARLASIRYFNSVVRSNLANGDCSTPLPLITATPPILGE